MVLSEIAILYRTNAQSVLLQRKLEGAGIPCKVQGGASFFKLREVRDILSLLKWFTNPNHQEALVRAAKNLKLKIGEALILKVYEDLHLGNVELHHVVEVFDKIKKDNSRYEGLRKLVDIIKDFSPTIKVVDFLNILYDKLGIVELLREEDIANREEKESFREESAIALLSIAKDVDGTCQDFLDACELQEDKQEEKDAVILSTIHKSKGQEYSYVFVLGCSDKILPHGMTYEDINRSLQRQGIYEPSRSEIEGTQEYLQELNLMYVAQTRAKNKLVMTHSEYHQGYQRPVIYKRSPLITPILPLLRTIGRAVLLPEKKHDSGWH